MNNQILSILYLINEEYLLNRKKPKIKLFFPLYQIKNINDLINLLNKYKDNEEFSILLNHWLLRFYHYACSFHIEQELCKFPYIEEVPLKLDEVDVKVKLKEKLVYDVKLTFIPHDYFIENDKFININADDNSKLKYDLIKKLYDYDNKNENRIYFLLKSKSNNKIKELENKANFELIDNEIKKYFSDKENLEKMITTYKNDIRVIVIPILLP